MADDQVNEFKIDRLKTEAMVGALTILKDWAADPVTDKEALDRVRVAQAIYGAAVRHEATQVHRDHLEKSTFAQIAKTPEDWAHYLKITQPSSSIVKALPKTT